MGMAGLIFKPHPPDFQNQLLAHFWCPKSIYSKATPENNVKKPLFMLFFVYFADLVVVLHKNLELLGFPVIVQYPRH